MWAIMESLTRAIIAGARFSRKTTNRPRKTVLMYEIHKYFLYILSQMMLYDLIYITYINFCTQHDFIPVKSCYILQKFEI